MIGLARRKGRNPSREKGFLTYLLSCVEEVEEAGCKAIHTRFQVEITPPHCRLYNLLNNVWKQGGSKGCQTSPGSSIAEGCRK